MAKQAERHARANQRFAAAQLLGRLLTRSENRRLDQSPPLILPLVYDFRTAVCRPIGANQP